MSMLIISSLDTAIDSFRRHNPARVVSLLSEDEALPLFPGFDDARHLKLYVEQESCAVAINAAARKRASELVRFAQAWAQDSDITKNILVHCQRGVSRSTAAGFVILCAAEPETPETVLLSRIRQAAPHADPCPLLVHYADEIMGRDGRMLDALDDLGPPTTVLSAPAAAISIAA